MKDSAYKFVSQSAKNNKFDLAYRISKLKFSISYINYYRKRVNLEVNLNWILKDSNRGDRYMECWNLPNSPG